MLKLELLKKLLSTKDEDLKKIDIDQLQTILGVFRYMVRLTEREINRRTVKSPFGASWKDIRMTQSVTKGKSK